VSESRRFLIYWAGQTLSAMGDAFAMVALPLLVLEATGSVAKMGLVSALGVVAQVGASLFAGQLVDRVDRRRLMIACDLGRAIIYTLVPVYWLLHGPALWLLALTALLGGALANTFLVAYVAALPSLVSADRLNQANSRLQSAAALAYVLGPILAGVVATRTGASWALAIDALSFLVSVASLLSIRFSSPAAPRPHALDSARWAGPRFIWANPTLRAVLILMVLLGLTGSIGLGAGVTDLLVYHLKHDLGLGSHDVGLCLGLAAVGAVVGAVFAPRFRRRWGFGACFLGGTMVQALGLATIGLIPSSAATALGSFLWAGGMLVRAVPATALRQEVAPHALLGRVTSTFWTFTFGASALGTTAVTRLAASVGANLTFIVVGAAVGSITAVGVLTPARTRRPEETLARAPSVPPNAVA
jgi:MFS family permease